MIILKKNKVFSAIILLFSIFIIPGVSAAERVTLKEAINLGLENNNELRDIKERVASLERDLALLKAKQDWQVALGANYNTEKSSVNMNISKTFSSGLTLKPGISVTEKETSLSIDLIQPLFPFTLTEDNKEYYKTVKELLKAKASLEQKKADKILSWLESYLDICRMMEKREIYQMSIKKAEDNLGEVLAKQKIGEAGKKEVLTAQVSLKNAEYMLREIDYKIDEAQLSLMQDIGLKNKEGFVFDAQSEFVNDLKQTVEELATKYLEENEIMSIVEQNNYDLLTNRIDREILQQELEWLKKEGKTSLDMTGSYNTNNKKLTVGLSLSYKLYDGGEYKLELEEKEEEIKNNLADYQELISGLELQLKQYTNAIKLNELELEKERLNLERSEYEGEVAKEQLEMGLIDYLEYQEYWISSKEAKVNLKSLQDQFLIGRLKLINFVNFDDIIGGLLK